MSTVMSPVSMPAALQEHLAGMDDQTRQQANDYMVEALEDFLFELEHGDRIKANLAAIKRGERQTYAADEVVRELGFDPSEIRAEARRQ